MDLTLAQPVVGHLDDLVARRRARVLPGRPSTFVAAGLDEPGTSLGGTARRRQPRVVLADDRVRVTLLPDRGGDIYAVEDLRTGVDVLWHTPWGLRRRGDDDARPGSAEAWLDTYAGGWQVLLPSGGGPSSHRGVHHPYHGEACSLPWAATIATAVGGGDHVELRVRLVDSPLLVERIVSLVPGRGEVVVAERVTNESDRPLDYMWVHHPAFGAPLVAPGARITTSASTIVADAAHDGPGNPLEPGTSHGWPSCGLETVAAWTCRSSRPHPRAGCCSDIWEASTRGRYRSRTMLSISPARCPGISTCSRMPGCGRSSARQRVSRGSGAPIRSRSSRRRASRHGAGRRRREQCHAPHPRRGSGGRDGAPPSPCARRAGPARPWRLDRRAMRPWRPRTRRVPSAQRIAAPSARHTGRRSAIHAQRGRDAQAQSLDEPEMIARHHSERYGRRPSVSRASVHSSLGHARHIRADVRHGDGVGRPGINRSGEADSSGGGGIRTHGSVRSNGFQDRPVRPLRNPARRQCSAPSGNALPGPWHAISAGGRR